MSPWCTTRHPTTGLPCIREQHWLTQHVCVDGTVMHAWWDPNPREDQP